MPPITSSSHTARSTYEQGYQSADRPSAPQLLSARRASRPESDSGSLLGKVWSAPNSLVGLLWGGLGVLLGAKPELQDNAIAFRNHPLMFGAITLGNTISYASDLPPERHLGNGTTAQHEHQHTLQGELLGPLYIPSNIVGGLAGIALDGSWHGSSNWNERGPQGHPPAPW